MRKVFFTAIMALVSCVAIGQTYDIRFKIIKEASETMGKEWDYSFSDAKYNPPYYVEFNGQSLKITNGTKDYINEKVSSVKIKEKTKTIYGKEVVTGKDYIIGVQKDDMWSYFNLKYMYLESGGYAILLYCPYVTDDGHVFSYNIYQSEIFE